MHTKTGKIESNPGFISILALRLASLAEPISQYLEKIKDSSDEFNQLPVPDLEDWLDMYRRPSRFRKMIRVIIASIEDTAQMVNDLYNKLFQSMEAFNLTDEQRIQFYERIGKAGFDVLPEFGNEDIEKWKRLSKTLFSEQDHVKKDFTFNADAATTEMIFFFKIHMPCYWMYKTYPIKLLRKARQGDYDALEQLIRLDKSIIFDNGISRLYHNSKIKRLMTERLNDSFVKSPKEKVDRKKIKMSIAGLISYVSEKIGQRLNEREIREYFNRVSKLKGSGDIDTDIPESPEAFAKAIQRERKGWEKL